MSILMSLNRDYGVTMVMVTHDMALKSFAHRVVNMLDGKISRIETIPPIVRNAAVAHLRAKPSVIEAEARMAHGAAIDDSTLAVASGERARTLAAASATAAGVTAPPGASVAGVSSPVADKPRQLRVMVRRPLSYATHRFAVERLHAMYGDGPGPSSSASASGAASSSSADRDPRASSSAAAAHGYDDNDDAVSASAITASRASSDLLGNHSVSSDSSTAAPPATTPRTIVVAVAPAAPSLPGTPRRAT